MEYHKSNIQKFREKLLTFKYKFTIENSPNGDKTISDSLFHNKIYFSKEDGNRLYYEDSQSVEHSQQFTGINNREILNFIVGLDYQAMMKLDIKRSIITLLKINNQRVSYKVKTGDVNG